MAIKVSLWREPDGWWTACLWGKASPILKSVLGNLHPASRATWRTRAEAEEALAGLLGCAVEVVQVYDRTTSR